jgi:cell division protease FtsH
LSKGTRGFILVILFFLAILFMAHYFQGFSQQPKRLSFSQFLMDVKAGKIKQVKIARHRSSGVSSINGVFSAPGKKEFKTRAPNYPNLVPFLIKHHVAVRAEKVNGMQWIYFLINVAPFILILVFIVWMMRQAHVGGSAAFSFGKSKHKMLNENRTKVSFDDVAGVEEAKEELQEIVEFLKNPKRFQALGARIPKGVLLIGPPGSGKTLLAKAVSGEAGVPFFSLSGSEFVEMFVGVGAARVRDLFEQAKRNAPCIVFVDEIDAVGRQRGAGLGGGHDEREQTLNQLLVEMDGFEPNSGVIILAATNRPDVLDPALLRAGRFDRQVILDRPDIVGRNAILKIHARKKVLHPDVNLDHLAKRTPGFSGADLENLLNEAALLAARAGKKFIEMVDCEEAIDRVLMGPAKKSKVMSEKEKTRTAYHEAGHALVGKLLPHADPVRKVTVLPRGMALGVTWSHPEEDKYNRTKEELIAQITVAMGGRAAEELAFGEISTGASNDIEKATELARAMITEFGMSERLGPRSFGRKNRAVFLGRDLMEDRNYSETVASKIDEEVNGIIDQCHQDAVKLLTENRNTLDRIAKELQDHEVLEGPDLDKIMQGEPLDKPKKSEQPAVTPAQAEPNPPENIAAQVKIPQGKVVPQEG